MQCHYLQCCQMMKQEVWKAVHSKSTALAIHRAALRWRGGRVQQTGHAQQIGGVDCLQGGGARQGGQGKGRSCCCPAHHPVRDVLGKELEIRVWSKGWPPLTPNFPSYKAHCTKECERRRSSHIGCVGLDSYAQRNLDFSTGECAGVSADGKHNIVFSRSHPQPQHLTSFDLKFASASLHPVRIETFFRLVSVWEWRARWPRSTSPSPYHIILCQSHTSQEKYDLQAAHIFSNF